MSRTPSPLPPALVTTPVFTFAEAIAAGVPKARLLRGDVARIAPGVHRAAGRPVAEKDVAAALCRAHPDAVVAGISAGRLWDVPLPRDLASWAPGDPIHLIQPGVRRRSTPTVSWRAGTLGDHEWRTGADGLRVTTAPRTFADLGSALELDDLVAVGDALVRVPRGGLEGRFAPWATLDALTSAVAAHRGRGARVLREALALVRVGSDSPAETRLRLALVRAGLPEPLANVPMAESGTALGVPDLHWPEWRVCLEHEGPHHLRPAQLARDIARAERSHRHGWIEVRTTSADLREGCARAVARAREALLRQGWRP